MLPIIKLHQTSKSHLIEEAIQSPDTLWCDFEGREADPHPALVGQCINGHFNQIVFDPSLQEATEFMADEKGLPIRWQAWESWLIETRGHVKSGGSIAGFSSHERTELIDGWNDFDLMPVHNAGSIYLDCNVATLFKRHNPELHDALKAIKKKASPYGHPTVGLKELLKHESIPYDYPKHLGTFKVGQRLKEFREQQEKKGSYQAWSRSTKKYWTNLLTYNEHDVLGMQFIVDWAWEHWRD